MNRIFILFIIVLLFSCEGQSMLFSKKIPEIKDSWSVLKSEHTGKPMIIRRNDGVNKISGKGYLNIRSGISYKFLIQTEDGLQSSDENPSIDKIEDKIYELFDNNKDSVVAIIITTSGFKEYIIYHNKDKNVSDCFNELKSIFTDYQLTGYTEPDKKWELYDQFK